MSKLTTDEVKTYFKEYQSGKLLPTEINGETLCIHHDENGYMITHGSNRYKIQGERRVRVTEMAKVKDVKTVKKSEPKPATTSVKCSACGKNFDRSKFNPNQEKCPVCRGSRKVPKQDQEKKCDICGKKFTVSKFTPYQTTCPDCKKSARKSKPKKEAKPKVAKATKKVEPKEGIPTIEV